MIQTKSAFYFGIEITTTNKFIAFSEGGGELSTSLPTRQHSHTDFASAIADALNAAGGLTYAVTFNRTDRTFTITASGTFELLVATGATADTSAYPTMGFTGGDRTGSTSYTGDAAGSEYLPQFYLQDWKDKVNNRAFISPRVNKSASGAVETIRFGTVEFYSLNIKYITSRDVSGSEVIENNPTGLADANTFMRTIIKKGNFEFMPDRSSRNTYDKVLLESTPESRDGIEYELKEGLGAGLNDYYETGVLVLRVL